MFAKRIVVHLLVLLFSYVACDDEDDPEDRVKTTKVG